MTKKLYKGKEYFITTFSLSKQEDEFMRKNGLSPSLIMQEHIRDLMKVADVTQREIKALSKKAKILEIMQQEVKDRFKGTDKEIWANGLYSTCMLIAEGLEEDIKEVPNV